MEIVAESKREVQWSLRERIERLAMKTVSFCTLIVLLLVGFVPAGRAQFTAQVNGAVSDSSGAMIAGSRIASIHSETNRTGETQSGTNQGDSGERLAL